MSNEATTVPSGDEDERYDSPLDRAAAQGPLPGTDDDDQPGGGVEEHVEDSTEQESRAGILGIHLNP